MKKYLNKKCREKINNSLKLLQSLALNKKISTSQYIKTKIRFQVFLYNRYKISKRESQKIVYVNFLYD